MATIRLRDWTKERIEEIRAAESHSSHDSVIKSLLKDRELAKFAGEDISTTEPTVTEEPQPPEDKAFDDLTVLHELTHADNGVIFLWCPNCGNEIAHLTVDDPAGLSVFEIECQRCLNLLDQHALVAIEIGYPIEQKLVDNLLQDDLKDCVIDYWDRTLEQYATQPPGDDVDVEHLVWQFHQYVHTFAWDWPDDVPAVGIEVGATYRDAQTDERIEVIEPVSENRNALDSFTVKRYADGETPADAEPAVMDSSAIVDSIVERRLLLEDAGAITVTDPNS